MRPPLIVTSTLDIASVLRADRKALGLSGEALDGRIGWPDRYAAKAENPGKRWAKNLIRVHPMGDLWLIGMNRALVLMDRDEAEKLVRGHVAAPETAMETVRVVRMTFR